MTLLMLFACGGCQDPEPEADEVQAPSYPDVVLITLDTTRADRLGCYGYEAADTPTLDSLCSAGRRYDRAYSPFPLTIPSHAALFTGMYPAALGIRDNGDGRLEPSAVTLTEVLKANGYQTVGSVSAFVTTRQWGFAQGFDAYFDEVESAVGDGGIWQSERRGGEAVDDLLGWMKGPERDADKPLFAWLHLYDAHFPYAPPDEYWEGFKDRPYDGELAYVDDLLTRVVDATDKANTLFVIVADHGESLGEHQELTHGMYVYDSTQRVPFILTGPGVEPGSVSDPVGLIDVMPTVLHTLGIPVPAGLDGQFMPGNPARPLYLESWALTTRFGFSPHLAVVDGEHKYIGTPRAEVYDLLTDPSEATDLEDPALRERLSASLAAFDYERPTGRKAPNDPSVAMQLQSLGYIEGSFAGDLTGDLPDPKDHREHILMSQKAEKAIRDKDLKEAERLLTILVAEYPDALEFHSRLAACLARQGRNGEAVKVLETALERSPDSPNLQAGLAVHYAKQGRYAEATALFQSAATALPWAPGLRAMAVASQLSVPGEQKKAVDLGIGYLQQYPDDYAVAGLVGVAFAKAGIPEGRQLLEEGIKADQPEYDVALLLGLAYMTDGDAKRATELFRLELANHPRNLRATQALISALDKAGDHKGVVQAASDGLVYAPDELSLLHARSQGQFNLADFAACRVSLDAALSKHPTSALLLLLDANLLAKEGKKEEGARRFEEATAAKAKEDARAASPAP